MGRSEYQRLDDAYGRHSTTTRDYLAAVPNQILVF